MPLLVSNKLETAALNHLSVTASVVTWNHAHCIQACLESLLKQTHKELEIIVSDNASSDTTRDILERFKGRVRIVLNSENRGFCGGHNPVIAQTKSDFVLLVNPDIVLSENYVERAIGQISRNDEIGTICGLLLQGEPDQNPLIDGTGLTVGRSRRFLLRHHGVALSSVALRAGEVFGCDGALPLYRRKMIETISQENQFFDEMFFAHKEDHDVSWRAQLFGWKTVFDPSCIAVHPRVFRPGNLQLRKTLAPEIRYHAVKNDLLLLLKNEDFSNFLKDFFYIVPRRVAIFLYALVREPHSLKAYIFVLKNLRSVLQKRKAIQKNRKASPKIIRAQFFR